jgi:uncharacterized protein
VTHHAPAPSPEDLNIPVDVVDLVGRTGSHRQVERSVTVEQQTLGNLALTVPSGETVQVDVEFESVAEGIYVGGTVEAHLTGECSRCLDPVEQDLGTRIDELFTYPHKVRKGEEEDVVVLEDETIDLGPLVRDALAVSAEDRPLCRPDCPGLCAQCGARLEDDPDHHHDVIDPRWAALNGLFDGDDEDHA